MNIRQQTLLKTKKRRKSQCCKVFELKLQYNKLNKIQKQFLNRIFLEAKWMYNEILNLNDFANYDTKKKVVQILNKNKEPEDREILFLGSQIKQELLKKTWNSIKSLSSLKRKGKNVGKLKFKSQLNCICLKQYGFTYNIINNKLKIQKCKKLFPIKGIEQILSNYEIASANLIKKPSGYYLKVTCFMKKEELINSKEIIGIDFGIKDDIVLSNGIKLRTKFPITKRIKKEHRKLSKKAKNSNNHFKQKNKLKLAYEKLTNKKKDAKNKIVSYLKNNYSLIAIQNENIKGWQSGIFGKQIQCSIIGGIISELKKFPQTLIIDIFFPSTKLCGQIGCGILNKISLSTRIYHCKCGYSNDRDIHAANNILRESIPMEHRNFKPVEFNISAFEKFKNFSNVNINYETGRYNSLELC